MHLWRFQEAFSAANFAANIQEALDILHAHVPKAIVLLSNIFDITPLPAFSDNLICDLVQGCVRVMHHRANSLCTTLFVPTVLNSQLRDMFVKNRRIVY